jgi:putative radical SAM enzyme (TIGR03279 family)
MKEILGIESGSIAEELGIKPGAKLLSINGKPIRDMLDYRFYVSGDELEVLLDQGGDQIVFEVVKEPQEDLGIILEDLKMRKCGNKCVFCFVHQNPKGLRKSLYFKDEDYRFSFLFGHYVTLTNAKQQDLERIVEQRLTPLYVSVHVTDPQLRKYMIGIRYDDHLLEKIEYLTSHGIELNCQIVICPDLNDGEYLDQTISELKKFYPGVKSIAIVPVGLTNYRKNLPELKPVTIEYSLQLMQLIDRRRKKLKQELGSSFVYLSDEFYIRTGKEIPSSEYYEGFYQLENGVGLTRDMINRFGEELPKLKQHSPDMHLTLVSGILGAQVLQKYFIPRLKTVPNLKMDLIQVTNHFFGETIVVAGLLTGQDIYNSLKQKPLGDYIILPPRVLNHDLLFLDDWTVDELENKLNHKIFIYPDSFIQLFENISAQELARDEAEAKRIRHTGPSLYLAEHMKSGEEWFRIAAEMETSLS